MSETSLIQLKTPPQELANIEAIASQCQLQLTDATGNFQRALTMAAGIRMLRSAITPAMMQGILELQGTKLGFRTDKDAGQGYPEAVVKECVIEHVLRGGMLVGNEMNIIAGNVYQTKEFFTRMLAEFPGLTDLKLFPGVPVGHGDKGALVAYSASWKLHGKPDRIDRGQTKLEDGTILDERLSIRVNSGMGPDAVLGKAERKIKAAIYARITGTVITDGDISDGDAPRKSVANLSDLTQRLEEKSNGNGTTAKETILPDGEVVTYDETTQIDPAEAIAGTLAAYKIALAAATDLAACNDLEETYLRRVPENTWPEITGRADERRDAIRAGRGSKSNKKETQGELVGAK